MGLWPIADSANATLFVKTASHVLKLGTDQEIAMLERNEAIEQLEVYDERGRPLGSVLSPRDPGLIGADKGTVYLARPLPTNPESVRPAQAA
jgi:hypothetical protein